MILEPPKIKSLTVSIVAIAEKQQLEQDMEQQTGSKLGKKYIKAVYVHPALQNHFQMVTAAMKLKDSCSLEDKLWPT